MKLKALDAEYTIKKDSENKDKLIVGVISKSLNASSWLRIDNEYLSKSTCNSILNDLEALEDNLVLQKTLQQYILGSEK